MLRKTGLLVILISGFYLSKAQSSRDVDRPTPPKPVYQAEKQKKGLKKILSKKKDKSELEKFRERMAEVRKEKRKEEKLAQKPQYTNPLYFGHKKPPKKRPLGKQKYCKVCQLKH